MMFANVSDRLLVAVRCGCKELSSSSKDISKLTRKQQPHQN